MVCAYPGDQWGRIPGIQRARKGQKRQAPAMQILAPEEVAVKARGAFLPGKAGEEGRKGEASRSFAPPPG